MISLSYLGAFLGFAIASVAMYLLLHGNGWNFEISVGGAIGI